MIWADKSALSRSQQCPRGPIYRPIVLKGFKSQQSDEDLKSKMEEEFIYHCANKRVKGVKKLCEQGVDIRL